MPIPFLGSEKLRDDFIDLSLYLDDRLLGFVLFSILVHISKVNAIHRPCLYLIYPMSC